MRGGNFLNLKAQQIQLLRVGFFIHDERGFFIFQNAAAADEFAKFFARFFQTAERIENQNLFAGVQQRLMIVRAVHIHKPFANGRERGERGCRTVDELAIRATRGKISFQHELMFLARFETVFFEKSFQRCAEFFGVEDGFDGTAFFAAADERAVGAFAQNQI